MKVTAASLGSRWGLHERRVQRILDAAGIPANRKTGYTDIDQCVDAVVRHFVAASDNVSEEAARDDARRKKAEANSAELDALKKANELIFVSDAEAAWADGFAQIVLVVRKANYIPVKSREKLTADFLAIKLPKLKE